MTTPLDEARSILEQAVADGVTPGAQLAVIPPDGRLAALDAGRMTYRPESASVRCDTLYDLASLTKPLTALAWVCTGVDLGTRLDAFLPTARGLQPGGATLEALLSHRAGLVHWAPLYEQVKREDRGLPAGRDGVVHAALSLPVARDRSARYSDVGYILAGEALARWSGTTLDASVREQVLEPLGLADALTWRGVGARWRDDPLVAPTELCPWRGLLQGEVHDDNAWTMGGVAGHAGVFGTATSLARLGRAVLDVMTGHSRALAGPVVEMVKPRPGGTHRLGWDGRSAEGSSSGTRMGPRTFGHLGFTGTSLWCDPDAGMTVALVTNRVHPSRNNPGIRALRPALHDAVFRGYRI